MIGRARLNYLQTEIVRAIRRAYNNDTLSKGGVEEIFGDLLKDVTIKFRLETSARKDFKKECDKMRDDNI